MCLAKITNWHKKDSGVGWKIFCVDQRKQLITPFYYRKVRVGKWERARKGKIYFDCGLGYPAGFHIFRFKKDAIAFKKKHNLTTQHLVLKKVKYRKVTCSGVEHCNFEDRDSVVAKEMYVMPKRRTGD